MNITSSARASARWSRVTVTPLVTSRSAKEGASLPSGVIVDGTAISPPRSARRRLPRPGGQLAGDLDERAEGVRVGERAGARDLLGRGPHQQALHGDLEALAVQRLRDVGHGE